MLNLDRVMEVVKNDEDIGFCITCGEEYIGVEPDRRKMYCVKCRTKTVYGAEEILLQKGGGYE